MDHVSRLTNHVYCLLTAINCHSKYVQHEDTNGPLSLALRGRVLGEAIAGVVVGRAIGVAVVVRAVAACLALACFQNLRPEIWRLRVGVVVGVVVGGIRAVVASAVVVALVVGTAGLVLVRGTVTAGRRSGLGAGIGIGVGVGASNRVGRVVGGHLDFEFRD